VAWCASGGGSCSTRDDLLHWLRQKCAVVAEGCSDDEREGAAVSLWRLGSGHPERSCPTAGRCARAEEAPVNSKTAAARWVRLRERELLSTGAPTDPVPERSATDCMSSSIGFWTVTLERSPEAERDRGKETILRVHLVPLLGCRKLDSTHERGHPALEDRMAEQGARRP